MAEENLLQIAQGLKAVAPVGQGFSDRSALRYNAGSYREQARQTTEAAGADAEEEAAALKAAEAYLASGQR